MEDIKETKKCGERGFGGEGYHWRPLCYEHMLYPFTQTWVRGASVGSLGSLRWMFLQLEMLWSKIWLPPWESGGMRECMTDCFSGGVRRLLQAGISLQPTLLRQEIWCFLGGSAHQGSSGVPMKWPLKVLHKRKTQLSAEQEMSSGRHHRVSPFLLCVVPWGLGRADCFHSSSAGAWQFKFELWLSIIEGGYSSFSLEGLSIWMSRMAMGYESLRPVTGKKTRGLCPQSTHYTYPVCQLHEQGRVPWGTFKKHRCPGPTFKEWCSRFEWSKLSAFLFKVL